MKSFKIDPKTGDIMFDGQNNIIMVEEDDDIIQCVERAITTNLGEWFLNPLMGFARFEVLGQKHDPDHETELLYAVILQEDRIESIEDLKIDFDRSSRELTVQVVLIKLNGERLEATVNVNGFRF